MTLGTRLRELRTATGVSLNMTAGALGISPAFLSIVERDIQRPGDALLQRMADRYGVPFRDLLALLGRLPDDEVRRLAAERSGLPVVAPDQPPPTPNDLPAVWDLVREDMAARDAVGLRKYGTRLQPHNGRDTLRDAYEEALDLAVYLRTALYERDGR